MTATQSGTSTEVEGAPWPARMLVGRAGDPPWVRLGLLAVLALAGVLYTWYLSQNGDGNLYYAAAVRSAGQSWKAFFFGSADAASFVTVDKPPLALWLMALSCRIFGYNSWSLLLPNAVAGVATVGVLFAAVKRFHGPVAGLVAALVLALTPITVVTTRVNLPEPLLVLLLVAAAWACLEAIRSGRMRPLLLSAVLIGLAFETKMLQAYLVLPAFVLAYLVAAGGGVLGRIGRLAVSAVPLLAVSAVWPAVVDLWSKDARPYVGGSTDNTETNLIFCYNGLQRIVSVPCRQQGGFGGGTKPLPNASQSPDFGGASGLGRLFNVQLAGQISWLLPAATLAFVVIVVVCGRSPRTDPRRAAALLWGSWILVDFVVFSFTKGLFHTYYTAQIAPAMAALIGGGIAALAGVQWSRARWIWLAGLAGTGLWAALILRRTPHFVPALPSVILAGVVVIALAVFGLGRRLEPRAGLSVVLSGVAVVALAGPTAYAVSPLLETVSGYAPQAGPPDISQGGIPPLWPGAKPPVRHHPGRLPDGRPDSSGGLGQADPALTSYLMAHRDGATWLVATTYGMLAADITLQSGGRPVMAMGGFGGIDPILTVSQVARYVQTGRLHYFLIEDMGPWAGAPITGWVRQSCGKVPASEYARIPQLAGFSSLYRCR